MRLTPRGLKVVLAPRGPTDTLGPERDMFSVTPGAILNRRKNRQPIVLTLMSVRHKTARRTNSPRAVPTLMTADGPVTQGRTAHMSRLSAASRAPPCRAPAVRATAKMAQMTFTLPGEISDESGWRNVESLCMVTADSTDLRQSVANRDD